MPKTPMSSTNLSKVKSKKKPYYEVNPKKKVNKIEKQVEQNENLSGIFKLNFDCLVHVISFLGLKDLANLDKASDNFKPFTDFIYGRYKSFDYKTIRPVRSEEGRTVLKQIGSYITSLIIDQNDLNTNSHDLLELAIQLCTNLEHIRIDDITLNNKMLKKMQKLFPKFKSIELISCGLGDSIYEYLAAAKSLEKLSLQKNAVFGSCISKLKNLVSLDLSYCEKVRQNFFTEFCQNNRNLIHLNIVCCHVITTKSVVDITTNLLNLEELCISSSYNNLSQESYLEFSTLPKLKKLQIKPIKSIPVAQVDTRVDDLLMKFAQKDKLQVLDISMLKFTKKTVDALVIFTKLEILKINESQSRFDLNDEMLFKLLQINENITELHLSSWWMWKLPSAELISFIEKSPKIRVLDIRGNHSITEDFYYSLLGSLKEQNRQHPLKVFVFDTKMKKSDFTSEHIAKNKPWIQLDFSVNEELNKESEEFFNRSFEISDDTSSEGEGWDSDSDDNQRRSDSDDEEYLVAHLFF